MNRAEISQLEQHSMKNGSMEKDSTGEHNGNVDDQSGENAKSSWVDDVHQAAYGEEEVEGDHQTEQQRGTGVQLKGEVQLTDEDEDELGEAQGVQAFGTLDAVVAVDLLAKIKNRNF